MADNFYSVLGVSEKATKDEIKKAYRGLQMRYHPDKNPGSQESVEMTQKINEAYETLGDEQKRGAYDNTRLNPNPFMRMASQGGGSAMEVPIDDIFNMFLDIIKCIQSNYNDKIQFIVFWLNPFYNNNIYENLVNDLNDVKIYYNNIFLI